MYVYRSYEPSESLFLRSALKKGMCFVDVGANLGYFTALASQIVGEGGRVIAIEPDPYNYVLLESNIRYNRLGNVCLHNLALGPTSGTGMLSLSKCNLGDHRLYGSDNSRETVPVRIETLDSVATSLGVEPNVIKMDVQGFEYHVLQGMRKTLEDDHLLVIITEFWPHGISESGASPRQFVELLDSFGFKASVLLKDGKTQDMTFEGIVGTLSSHQKGPNELEDIWMNLVFHR